MFEEGQTVVDKEFGFIITIESKEWDNEWIYLCSLANGALGYRYEHELQTIEEYNKGI